jgi:hypothetical protein
MLASVHRSTGNRVSSAMQQVPRLYKSSKFYIPEHSSLRKNYGSESQKNHNKVQRPQHAIKRSRPAKKLREYSCAEQ